MKPIYTCYRCGIKFTSRKGYRDHREQQDKCEFKDNTVAKHLLTQNEHSVGTRGCAYRGDNIGYKRPSNKVLLLAQVLSMGMSQGY